MTTFQKIKSTFKFLEKDFDFKVADEVTTEVFDFDYQFEIVAFANKYVVIEIGYGGSLFQNEIGLEMRKLQNGVPVGYNHANLSVNLEELIQYTQKHHPEETLSKNDSLEHLAEILKRYILHLTTDDWFNTEALKVIKSDTQVYRNETIKAIEDSNEELLNAKGFKFLKSNDTISSFEYWENPFIVFSSGKETLTIKDNTCIKDNYFYYHIYLTKGKMRSVEKLGNYIEKIGHEISVLLDEKMYS